MGKSKKYTRKSRKFYGGGTGFDIVNEGGRIGFRPKPDGAKMYGALMFEQIRIFLGNDGTFERAYAEWRGEDLDKITQADLQQGSGHGASCEGFLKYLQGLLTAKMREKGNEKGKNALIAAVSKSVAERGRDAGESSGHGLRENVEVKLLTALRLANGENVGGGSAMSTLLSKGSSGDGGGGSGGSGSGKPKGKKQWTKVSMANLHEAGTHNNKLSVEAARQKATMDQGDCDEYFSGIGHCGKGEIKDKKKAYKCKQYHDCVLRAKYEGYQRRWDEAKKLSPKKSKKAKIQLRTEMGLEAKLPNGQGTNPTTWLNRMKNKLPGHPDREKLRNDAKPPSMTLSKSSPPSSGMVMMNRKPTPEEAAAAEAEERGFMSTYEAEGPNKGTMTITLVGTKFSGIGNIKKALGENFGVAKLYKGKNFLNTPMANTAKFIFSRRGDSQRCTG